MVADPSLRRRTRVGLLTLAVSLTVLGLKLGAYLLTGSVALLSDAAESVINVAGAVSVLIAVRLALRPPDYEHPYGHQKAEYLSSAFEGTLILLAAGMILITGVQRLFDPPELTRIAEGVAIAALALVINGATAWYLQREARRIQSVALLAHARHLLIDVWTSIGVLVAVVLISLSGWLIFDPIVALVVGVNIVREGWRVLTGSLSDLMDARLPDAEERVILATLDAYPEILGYHRLRTRKAGRGRFAELDIFVKPTLSVKEAHDLVAALEDELIRKLPRLITTVHVEPYVPGQRDGAHAPRDEFRPG